MRLKYFAIFLISSLLSSAQNKTGVEVEYQAIHRSNSLPMYGSGHAVLYAISNASIYTDYDDAVYKEGDAFPEKRALTNNYLKIDNAKKEMLLFEDISKPFLVKDIYHEFTWNISSETKTIGSYDCVKATTSYRGRNWTAWFAPQIAIPFGPWKLHGLPGLILEANDDENENVYKAVKVEFKTSSLFDKDFTTLVKTRNKKPISYQQFLADRKEMFSNISSDMQAASRGTESYTPTVKFGPELKYEWEK